MGHFLVVSGCEAHFLSQKKKKSLKQMQKKLKDQLDLLFFFGVFPVVVVAHGVLQGGDLYFFRLFNSVFCLVFRLLLFPCSSGEKSFVGTSSTTFSFALCFQPFFLMLFPLCAVCFSCCVHLCISIWHLA